MRPVIIIGAGIAGLTAAITLAQQGQKSILVSAVPSERAQSVMAEGGINAALNTKGQNDSVQEHFRDTMAAGCDLADPSAVRALTEGAPDIVHWLAGLGVAFNRTAEGKLDLRYFGGQKKQRTAFARSATGKQIMTALIQETRRWESRGLVERRMHHTLQKLVVNGENACTGCIISDDYTNCCQILTGNVLLATGGLNGLFGKTTGTTQNTGDATAAAYAAGAACANLEMIQYHPTTTPISGKRALISEAARGEGGRLFVRRGGEKWYYMEENYPELKNLMPRDVVSRETERVCRENGQENAWLDLTDIPEKVFEEKLTDLREFCLEFLHLDPKKEYIPVYPGIHYFMGGLYVDDAHRTTLHGLYAAGECACQYHGANRLGGNSLLGAAFGGKRAAETILADLPGAAETDAQTDESALDDWQAECSAVEKRTGAVSCAAVEKKLEETLKDCMGIRRCEEELTRGAVALEALAAQLKTGRDARCGAAEQILLERRVELAQAMVDSARARRESRGAQCRTDYPERNDAEFCKTTVARRNHGSAEITFAALPKEGRP